MTYPKQRAEFLLLSALFIMIIQGCGSSYQLRDSGKASGLVILTADSLVIQSETENLSPGGLAVIRSEKIVQTVGSELLEDILKAYRPTTDPYSIAENEESADFILSLNRIDVDQRSFTLNIPHPGPVYKMKMTVDIIYNSNRVQRETYRCSANMSEVNFADENSHWMSSEEKANPSYQEETFREALRSCYQDLYFNLFDIRI